jgi:tetratricopeptide (TPR) repeat protein
MHRALSLWMLLMLGGCAGINGGPGPASAVPKVPDSASEVEGVAQALVKKGRWSEAIALLDDASERFPDAPGLASQRDALRARWRLEERRLEDQIMVGKAENQKTTITLLEQLSLAQPGNLIVTSRRIYWKEALANKVGPLTECAEFHVGSRAELARRCLNLASALAITPDIEQRLAAVSDQLRISERIDAERLRVREEKARQHRAKALLGQAKAAIDARDYRKALDILDQVAGLQPDNSEVVGLQEEALAMISPQVEALVKLGDHLYLDEQLDAAVATWQAALTLKPDDEAILARVERAKTVLNRLDALRLQQQPLSDDGD